MPAPSYILHPSTLDGLAQLVVPALTQHRGDLPTMVPVHVARIWVDCSSTELSKGKIQVAAQCNLRGYRGASANIVGTLRDSGYPLVYFDGLETTFISSTATPSMEDTQMRSLCTRLMWKPDIDVMNYEQVLRFCTQGRPKEAADAVSTYRSLLVAIMAFVEEAIAFLEENPTLHLERHLEAYASWMMYQRQRVSNGELLYLHNSVHDLLSDRSARGHLITQVENSGADGFFFMQVGRNLLRILSGEVDPLDLMFRDGLADHYYERMLANDHHAHPASAYIDLLCFKNPSMRILEVGAGTGGQTLRLLETMSADGVKKWAQYDYTDISPGFFGQARAKFQEYADRMTFRVCDISKDPLSQSFEKESYDIVVASHVLHATDDLDQSLRNIRKLLKPGGKLFLFETTRPEAIHIGFAFGLLKGWWSPLDHEPRSRHSPCLTTEQWDNRLRRTGFSGVAMEIPGQENLECQYSSIIIANAVEPDSGTTKSPKEIALVVTKQKKIHPATIHLVQRGCVDCLSGFNVYTLAELSQLDNLESVIVVSLLELEATFLDNISEVNYTHLKTVLTKSKEVLWVTKALSDHIEPRHYLSHGLGRALMSEDLERKFVTLSLDAFGEDAKKMADIILRLVKLMAESGVENLECNYVATQDGLKICRVSENGKMDKRVAQATAQREEKDCQFRGNTQLELQIRSPGHLNTLEWIESEKQLCEFPLLDDEVDVEVKAVGLTFRDHLVASGQLNALELGTECAGIIRAAGRQSGFQLGDRVCLIGCSTLRSAIRVKSDAAVVIPSGMGFTEAATMPTALCLAYHALVNVSRLQRGETVLIYQGASCTGQLAIRLARNIGANVLVTTSSATKGEFLHRELKVPKDAIFYSDDASNLRNIYQKTHGEGLDVVIGSLMDDTSVEFLECIAPFGRLVDIGLTRTASMREPTLNMRRNVSRANVNIFELLKSKPSIVYRTFQEAMKLGLKAQFTPPRPLHVFRPDQIELALHHFQDADVAGKRIIEVVPDSAVLANVKTRPRYRFPADATYVIAGGLGGLGRSFARWMASRGARNLVLLSRSGAETAPARTLLDELQTQGVFVAAPQVDISDITSLKNELQRLVKHMPPIRGCIQATVALRDNLFENMTYEDWLTSTRSKVTGSWNLHETLPVDLDFFILLSSVNGIFGGRAQANYAAGNTFKDALAHYRIAHGQKAVSIDLGLMVAEGVVAENEFLLASMRRIGHLMDITQDELIALLDFYCDPSLPLLADDDAQILVGIEMPSAVLAKGIDLHHSIRRPMFRHLFQMGSEKATMESCNTEVGIVDHALVLKRAASQDEAAALVTKWFCNKIGQVLGLADADIDVTKPVHTYGIDSLVAIDLKNWFGRAIGAEIEAFLLLGNLSLEQLSTEAAKKSRYRREVLSAL
ncbi:hypothetical protein DL764_009708 [Monosporascus ibericus]|uniref:Carrier domain-containing protein n=1 Tax=Monosporascus ibericus TaxID=155417 RepID=A0A4Q4SU91_9PEZI|nr:hypothetical protein DL764_009708 [Monosporascus ibericus]